MSKAYERAGWLAVLALCSVALRGSATEHNPTRTIHVHVGAPGGAAPMAGFNTSRTHSTHLSLPHAPVLSWRARISGGIRGSVVSDGRGHVVASTLGNALVELDSKGKQRWIAHPPEGVVVTGPAILSGGARVALTSTGALLSVSENGGPPKHHPLPLKSASKATDLLPVSSGGVVVAAGREALWLTQDLGLRARARLPNDIVEVLARRSDVILVASGGEVLSWKPPEPPRRVASFGGKISRGAALSSDKHVSAVVDEKRLLDVNLKMDTRHIRMQGSSVLEGPPTVLPNGELLVMSRQGLVLGFDRKGLESWRVATEPGVRAPGGGGAGLGILRSPPIIGSRKHVAVARPGLDVAIVSANGNLQLAKGTACPDPESLIPTGPSRLVLACSSGQVFGITSGKTGQ